MDKPINPDEKEELKKREIRYYHLFSLSKAEAIVKLTAKAYQAGMKTCILSADELLLNEIDEALWDVKDNPFIPHLFIKTSQERDEQTKLMAQTPIILTSELSDISINHADLVILCDSDQAISTEAIWKDVNLIMRPFMGNDEANLTNARMRWLEDRELDYQLSYWQQSNQGWQLKSKA